MSEITVSPPPLEDSRNSKPRSDSDDLTCRQIPKGSSPNGALWLSVRQNSPGFHAPHSEQSEGSSSGRLRPKL